MSLLSPVGAAGAPAAEQGTAGAATRARILCVDDEPAVLDGLRRQLYRDFTVVGAGSGREALALLETDDSLTVIMSDMRMPELDGAAVLGRARAMRPDVARVLLTGQADLEAAAAAVNDGNIFRFLLKPCPRPLLVRALGDAVEQHRLVTAERDLLEQTLRGSVGALVDTLALANPLAFARAARIRQTVRQLIEATGPPGAWRIEVATMLSQIGTVVLAPETLAKLHQGAPLTSDEEVQVRDLPRAAEALLGHIPRLEGVCRIIRDQTVAYRDLPEQPGGKDLASGSSDPDGGALVVGASMLRIAIDLDSIEAAGDSRPAALAKLAACEGSYDPDLLAILAEGCDTSSGDRHVRAIPAAGLRPGMTIASDITDDTGRLLVGHGHLVTDSLIDRIRNWRTKTSINEPIYVTDG